LYQPLRAFASIVERKGFAVVWVEGSDELLACEIANKLSGLDRKPDLDSVSRERVLRSCAGYGIASRFSFSRSDTAGQARDVSVEHVQLGLAIVDIARRALRKCGSAGTGDSGNPKGTRGLVGANSASQDDVVRGGSAAPYLGAVGACTTTATGIGRHLPGVRRGSTHV